MQAALNGVRALILDMDGVLWHGEKPIGDLPGIFSRLARGGYRVALATNNATLSIGQFLDKLARFGVRLASWQVVSSSVATTSYLKQRHPQGGPVFIVGEAGLHETLISDGFFQAEENVLAVVAGLDRDFSYEKMKKATLLIRAGAPFIGTNSDNTLPTPEGQIPGAGAILAAIETASGVQPLIIGKPSPEMYRIAMQRLGSSPADTLVIGDRLETDIVGAQELGCRTGLVLSGVTSQEQALAWRPAPDCIAPDLGTMVDYLP